MLWIATATACKGAFVKSLAEFETRNKMPPILWQPDRAQPSAYGRLLKEDEHGLYGEGNRARIDDVPKARETSHSSKQA